MCIANLGVLFRLMHVTEPVTVLLYNNIHALYSLNYVLRTLSIFLYEFHFPILLKSMPNKDFQSFNRCTRQLQHLTCC